MLQTTITPDNKINYSETPLEDLLQEYAADREEFNLPVSRHTPDKSPDNPPDPSAGGSPSASAGASHESPADPSGDPEPKPSVEQARELKGKRQFTAKFLAKNTDRAFAFINSMIADSDDVDDWKASPEDLEDIKECYFEMCQAYGWSGLPPWLSLIMCILFTYGPAAKEAYKVRGINKEIAAKAARAEADRLIAQAEVDRLRKEKEDPPAAETEKKEPANVETTNN